MGRARSIVLVETTLPANKSSELIIQEIVESRLAACANWAPVHSSYWWRKELAHEDEWHVSFKTSVAARAELVRTLKDKHPYEVPYIAWRVRRQIDPDYAAWVAEETGGPKGGSKRAPRSS